MCGNINTSRKQYQNMLCNVMYMQCMLLEGLRFMITTTNKINIKYNNTSKGHELESLKEIHNQIDQ